MTLSALLEQAGVVAVHGDDMRDVAGIAYDSRRVRPGDVFFALSGRAADGARFLDAAFAAGAAGAVVARGTASAHRPLIEVEEPRRALAIAAARLHGDPSRAMKMAGVTGTNGKTTTTYLLESIFRAAGWTPGVIGTTGIRVGSVSRPSLLTTPEAPELQALLAEMREARVAAVAMEVSSHALIQRRAYDVAFDVVAFTNLTQDHLDYHGTMEAYLDAKLMLFDGRNGGAGKQTIAVVNGDDPAARRFSDAARAAGLSVLIYGAVPLRAPKDAVVMAQDLKPGATGIEIGFQTAKRFPPESRAESLASPREKTFVRLPLLGRYNASNAACAYGVSLALGLAHDAIVRGLESVRGVPGRLERVDAGQPFTVAVDYAHTPDALERALAAVREHSPGRVLLVFGAGGDRDKTKRPVMGAIAARASDLAWITNDNPRGEDPAAIAREIAAGDPSGRLRILLDRREAIGAALTEARAGDVVLIAGKGHETTQTIGGEVLPFDDRAVAREWLGAGGAA